MTNKEIDYIFFHPITGLMKRAILIISWLFSILEQVSGQQNYNDFEGNKMHYFGYTSGVLDSAADNPGHSTINYSKTCAQYKRSDTLLYDFILIHPHRKLIDVSHYSTYMGTAEKIKMKIFTTAPVGTSIELQLGAKEFDDYPQGIHSQYQAITTIQHAWEDVTFNFSQILDGSLVAQTEIDKLILLFSPNTNRGDIYYFDDLTGPDLIPASGDLYLIENEFDLKQNFPNPAMDNTTIEYNLISSGTQVSLKLFDKLGKEIFNLVDQKQVTGSYRIILNTENLKGGIYFYSLTIDQVMISKKIIIFNSDRN